MVAVLRALAGSGFLIASTILAQAAEPFHLRVADSFPKGHYLVKLVLEPWMEEVKKRTNNAVDVRPLSGAAARQGRPTC